MKYCNNCGKQLADEARFCSGCGNPVPGKQVVEDESGRVNAAQVLVPGREGVYPGSGHKQAEDLSLAGPAAMPVDYSAPAGGQAASANRRRPPKRLLVYSLAALILIAALAMAAYAFGNFSPPGTPKLAPYNTELFICAKPNFFQARNFNKLKNIYLAIPEVSSTVDNFTSNFLGSGNLNYQDDIAPWLGGEAALIVPAFSDSSKMVLVAQQTDQGKAREFIDKLATNRGVHEEAYNDAVLIGNDGDFEAAISGGYLMLASDKTLLQQTIDRQRGILKDSLKDNRDYRKTVGRLPYGQSGFGYINLNNRLIREAIDAQVPGISDQFQAFPGMAMGIFFESSGIRSRYVISCDEKHPPAGPAAAGSTRDQVRESLKLVPADCLAMMRYPGFTAMLQDIYNSPNENPIKTNLKLFEQAVQVSLPDDIFNNCQGDAVISLLPGKGAGLPGSDSPYGVTVTLGIKDQQKCNATMNKIMLAVPELQGRVDKADGGFQVYTFADAVSQQKFAAVALGPKNALIGTPADVEALINPYHDLLADQAIYKRAFASFAGDAQPLLFVNIANLRSFMEQNAAADNPAGYNQVLYPWLFPLESISISSSGYDEGTGVWEGEAYACLQK